MVRCRKVFSFALQIYDLVLKFVKKAASEVIDPINPSLKRNVNLIVIFAPSFLALSPINSQRSMKRIPNYKSDSN